ncbi:DegV family protein [Corynebacterium ulceribovis]|uniref:DegV family protein n=1 Tax=Corynebacterium ulceribovis TaxID=487732 RepID=UPI0003644185|nr:DegV family protein [Corynebacterium ulceribovis]
MTVKVIVDSASCLPKDVANRYGIVVLDMQATEETSEKSGFGAAAATTSALAPLELCAAYSRQLALGDDDGVLALHVSKALSSTWSNGVTAAEVLGDRVQVVDTHSVGMGIGFAAIAAAQRAEQGGTLAECHDAAKEVLRRSSMWAYVPHMEHLRRGGRLTAGATIISTALAMKPVVTLRDGKVELAAKTRTETKALSRLVELVVAESGDEPVDVAIQYAGSRRDAAELARVLTRFLGEAASVQLMEISAAVEVHSGPGALLVSVARKPVVGLSAGDVDASDPLQPSLFDGAELVGDRFGADSGRLGNHPMLGMPSSPSEAAENGAPEDPSADERTQNWSSWRETFRQATEKASELAAEIAAEFSSERAKRDTPRTADSTSIDDTPASDTPTESAPAPDTDPDRPADK